MSFKKKRCKEMYCDYKIWQQVAQEMIMVRRLNKKVHSKISIVVILEMRVLRKVTELNKVWQAALNDRRVRRVM